MQILQPMTTLSPSQKHSVALFFMWHDVHTFVLYSSNFFITLVNDINVFFYLIAWIDINAGNFFSCQMREQLLFRWIVHNYRHIHSTHIDSSDRGQKFNCTRSKSSQFGSQCHSLHKLVQLPPAMHFHGNVFQSSQSQLILSSRFSLECLVW